MPWTVADVDKHIKGLSDKQKRAWVSVANSALKRCQESGQHDNCDATAIRQANAAAKRVHEAQHLTLGLNRLVEVGRVLSATSEAQIRAAISALNDLLAKVAVSDEVESAIDAGVIETAKQLLEAEMSHDDVRAAISRALMAQTNQLQSSYIREVYDDYFVYSLCSYDGGGEYHLYKATYSINTDGSATLGTPEEVKLETSYVTVSEAAQPIALQTELVPLVEKAVRRDGTIPVKIIEPGWGSSGYYPKEVLQRDGPKVFAKGTKMYWDHPTLTERKERPERSLKDLAAELVSDARYEESGEAGPGLYADAKVFGPYKDAIEELAPFIGVSINAYGYHESGVVEGREGAIVKEMVADKLNSADFVTVAGAGGQIVQLFESARGRNTPPPPVGGSELNEQEAQQLREAAQSATQRAETAERELARMREAAVVRDHCEMVMATVNAMQMPDLTKTRLIESLKSRPVIKDGAYDKDASKALVESEAKAEMEYISQLVGTGRQSSPIVGMGQSAGSGELTDDQLSGTLIEAFKNMGLDEAHAKSASLLR